MSEDRQTLYMELIDQLLHCPNGQEPEILDAHIDLVDAGLVQGDEPGCRLLCPP